MGRRKRSGRSPVGVGALLWAAATVLMVASVAGAEKFVFRFKEKGSSFYLVKGFALATHYDVTVLPSACHCRRRCEVTPSCHSVSIVPRAAGGVECRTSSRPGDLNLASERPDLLLTSGATHFLQTDPGNWDEPEVDGMFYYVRAFPSNSPRCDFGYEFATAKSLTQYEIFKKFYDVYNTPLWVGLRLHNVVNTTDYEPRWENSTTTSPLEELPYDQSGLPASALHADHDAEYYFYLTKTGSDYEFHTSGPSNRFTLCQDNRLQLKWP
ncbi:uncharacterized protein LOC125042218 [Penaeus chinensis]|uniref:uncharacterized protein LOC125042218 n=1 Tax=Penaeus chinensis TaxID=139456 RepID=UPI001FB5F765|nr:uncharacterized protein LOC125042218 [Penaeus chinensis]